MQDPRCIQHPKHSAATSTEFIVTFDHVSFYFDATHDRTGRISQSVNQSHTPVHTVVAQYGIPLAFERHAHLYQPSVVIT